MRGRRETKRLRVTKGGTLEVQIERGQEMGGEDERKREV